MARPQVAIPREFLAPASRPTASAMPALLQRHEAMYPESAVQAERKPQAPSGGVSILRKRVDSVPQEPTNRGPQVRSAVLQYGHSPHQCISHQKQVRYTIPPASTHQGVGLSPL